MTEIETVLAFLDALEALDVDRALALSGPGIHYQNVPLRPARGLLEFERQLRMFARVATRFEVTTHHIASNGPIVLTERTDVIEMGGLRIAPWVCGTFEVRDGKIILWRDYFDWARLGFEVARGMPAMLVHPLRKALVSRTA